MHSSWLTYYLFFWFPSPRLLAQTPASAADWFFWDLGWYLNSSTSAANLHGLIDEVENATWRTDKSSFSLKIWPNCWKLGLRDGFGPSNLWHLCINWKRFLYIVFLSAKPLSFFENHFHFLDIYISKTCVKQGNSEIQKLGLRDGFYSSYMQYHVIKQREVIVFWHVRNKNLWVFCKMILQSLRIIILKRLIFVVKRQFRWLGNPSFCF